MLLEFEISFSVVDVSMIPHDMSQLDDFNGETSLVTIFKSGNYWNMKRVPVQ